MFKHLLLPTDGSDEALQAAKAGISLASDLGASVTSIYVVPEYRIFTLQPDMLEDTPEEYDRHCISKVDRYLGRIKECAESAGVECYTAYWVGDHPYEFIAKTAADRRCDLIVMASHHLSDNQTFFGASETQKVMSCCQIPVLVFRS